MHFRINIILTILFSKIITLLNNILNCVIKYIQLLVILNINNSGFFYNILHIIL